jgi:uncharacterized protein YndB with AHSA1/START domain
MHKLSDMLRNTLFCWFLCAVCCLPAVAQDKAAIQWPPAYEPAKTNFYVYNEVDIQASPATVWGILIQAKTWPLWYEGAEDVRFGTEQDSLLTPALTMSWKTMGMQFPSTVREFVPNRILAWESVKRSIQGYHTWLILPTSAGCRLITAESQTGWLTRMEKAFQPKKLHRLHQVWIEAIKAKAEAQEAAR